MTLHHLSTCTGTGRKIIYSFRGERREIALRRSHGTNTATFPVDTLASRILLLQNYPMTTASADLVTVIAILTLGSGLGKLSIQGFSLGSAGVLLVGIVFGHFGYTIPNALRDFGLVIFAYAVGLQAGPRFFRSFRKAGQAYLLFAAAPVGVALALSLLLGVFFDLSSELILGLFSGALTNNSALAAALHAMDGSGRGGSAAVSISYGVVYPFSVLSVILLMHLLPKAARRTLAQEEEAWNQQRAREQPPLEVKHFRVENPRCIGVPLKELNLRALTLNLAKVVRAEEEIPVSGNTLLALNDVVTIIGRGDALNAARVLLGVEIGARTRLKEDLDALEVEITEHSLIGIPLRQLELYRQHQVLLASVQRGDTEFTPTGDSVLELGDRVRAIGDAHHVRGFATRAGSLRHLRDETRMLPFLLGLFFGVAIGSVPVSIGGFGEFRLGVAGGAFFTSLILGHFGRIGTFVLYVPPAAVSICRELGLYLFFASAGTLAGQRVLEVVIAEGIQLCLAGMIVSTLSVIAVILLAHKVYRMNLLATLGIVSGTMTNPAGLMAIRQQTSSELPIISYTGVYAVSLIFKIFVTQLLVVFMR